MKTTSSNRVSRDPRAANNKRGDAQESNSRSRSKESGSISKREFKYGNYKSPNKSPLGIHHRQPNNNVIIYPARNESVKRMFQNLNRNKPNIYSIRK